MDAIFQEMVAIKSWHQAHTNWCKCLSAGDVVVYYKCITNHEDYERSDQQYQSNYIIDQWIIYSVHQLLSHLYPEFHMLESFDAGSDEEETKLQKSQYFWKFNL